MFEWIRARRATAPGALDSTSHPADNLLEQGMRLLPVPTPGADFDQKVLATLAAVPANSRRKGVLPTWVLPSFAAAGLALTAAVPATRAIVRTEVVSVYRYLGLWEDAPALVDSPLRKDQEWVTDVDPLISYDNAARKYQLPMNDYGSDYRNSLDGREARALEAVVNKWQDQPAFVAALLRHRLARTAFPGRTQARLFLRPAATETQPEPANWYAPPTSDEVIRLSAQAQAREPDNTFFTLANAAFAFERRQDAQAIRLIKRLPQTRRWHDYSGEEAVARYQWMKWRYTESARNAGQWFSYPREEPMPVNAVNGVTLQATAYAAKQERAGNVSEGIEVRLALLDLAAKIYANWPDDIYVARQVMMNAMEAPGGTEAHVRLGAHASAEERSRARSEEGRRFEARPERFIAYLRAQGAVAQANRVVQIQQALRRPETPYRMTDEEWRNRPLFVQAWAFLASTFLYELYYPRLGWTGLALLALSPLVAWGVAIVAAAVWRLPFLRRKEEFPIWVTSGAMLGILCEIGVRTLEGIFNNPYLNQEILLPVLAVLVIGVGYLYLRRTRLIMYSALAAVVGVCLAKLSIALAQPVSLYATCVWTQESRAELRPSNVWPREHPYEYPLEVFAPLMVLLVVSLVVVAFWRKRGMTWQVRCQQVARQSQQLGWVLVLVSCLWCANVARQEQALDKAYIQSRLSPVSIGGLPAGWVPSLGKLPPLYKG